jgi:hypothetical protein
LNGIVAVKYFSIFSPDSAAWALIDNGVDLTDEKAGVKWKGKRLKAKC